MFLTMEADNTNVIGTDTDLDAAINAMGIKKASKSE